MEISLDSILENGLSSYQKFLDGINDSETKKHYQKYLHMFLKEIPNGIYQQFTDSIPDTSDESKAEFFVKFCEKYPKMGINIIIEYVKIQKSKVELDEISPNTVPNYVKPIKVLLDQNDIPVIWKKIYNMYPRGVKSKDRAYSLKEVQQMLEVCSTIVDKVIISMHASAGFRSEAWDYFTWSDILIFRDNNEIVGGAVRIYHGDREEYWTHLTPETCKYIELYRESWIKTYISSPKPTDPLIRSPKYLILTGLKHKGVRKRVEKVVEAIGIRKPLENGQKRHPVKLMHGFRKYFNTMLRRAKVDFADKEKLMGHKIGLEDSYERYIEDDFEYFGEYKKAIPFLTISDEERNRIELEKERKENMMLKKQSSDNVVQMVLTKLAAGDVEFDPSVWKKMSGGK
jgi:integrase